MYPAKLGRNNIDYLKKNTLLIKSKVLYFDVKTLPFPSFYGKTTMRKS